MLNADAGALVQSSGRVFSVQVSFLSFSTMMLPTKRKKVKEIPDDACMPAKSYSDLS